MVQAKKNALANLKSTYCRLKPSKISGVGVFAVRDIPQNTKVFKGMVDQKWYRFKMSELKGLNKEVLKMIDDFFVIEKDGSFSMPQGGLNAMDISFFRFK